MMRAGAGRREQARERAKQQLLPHGGASAHHRPEQGS
jgi:hypothetical protein